MYKIYFLLGILFLICSPAKSQELEDVVYFKNGNIVRGMIIEQVPNETIKIKTRDGNVFVFNIADIEKIRKEPLSGNRNIENFSKSQYGISARKSPGVAFLLSFLVAGGGQFYNGQYAKGGTMLGINLVGGVAVYYAASKLYVDAYGNTHWDQQGLFTIGILAVLVNDIWSMVDAPMQAKAINQQLGLTFNYKLNGKINLALKPDYKLDCFSGRVNPVYGAKLSVNIR